LFLLISAEGGTLPAGKAKISQQKKTERENRSEARDPRMGRERYDLKMQKNNCLCGFGRSSRGKSKIRSSKTGRGKGV